MNAKKCRKCKVEKPLTEFHKDKSKKDGFKINCKSCIAQYYEENKEKIKERSAQYRSQNKEKIAEYKVQYYAQNKEKIAEYKAQNKEKIAEYNAQYHSQNKEKKAKSNAKHYVKKKAEQPNCVYQIKNLENNKVYIGETIRGEMRWKEHLRELKRNYHDNKSLQEDFNKYGEEVFEWTILEEFESDDKDTLLLEETRAIQQYIQDGVELYNLVLNAKQLEMLEEDKKSQ